MCDEGYYCDGGATTPTPSEHYCIPGHFCPKGSVAPIPCPEGTFSPYQGNINESFCNPCTPGFICSTTGLHEPNGECPAGYFCMIGTVLIGHQCPPGYFCPNGSSLPSPCKAGLFQPSYGQSECIECPEGYYCDPAETADNNTVYDSLPKMGTVLPALCPIGHVCPSGTRFAIQNPCPRGTYSGMMGLVNTSQCLSCPPGMYCADMGLSDPNGFCSPGYNCILGSSSPQPIDGTTGSICPRGSVCPLGTRFSIPCPSGTFSNSTGLTNMSECTPCLAGAYCSTPGLIEPTGICSPGYFCRGGASQPDPFNSSFGGGNCPMGFFCPQGARSPMACPAGTFQPLEGAQNSSDCIACPAGTFCDSSGLQIPTGFCDPGYFCKIGASVATPTDGSTGDICPAGSFCLSGSSLPVLCPDGTFTNYAGAIECSLCPAGYYCLSGMQPLLCPIGYFCFEGTAFDWIPCLDGTYGSREGLSISTECTACDGGYYCYGEAQIQQTGLCSAGHYCFSGVNVSEPTINNSHTGNGGLCPTGHYCPEGASIPLPCLPGSYNDVEGQEICFVCLSGHYCPAQSSLPIECPPGHYCPQGTSTYLSYPCPSGTYNNYTGAADVDDCTPCTPGEFCPTSGLFSPIGPCNEGYYCTSGSSTSSPLDITINCEHVIDGNFDICVNSSILGVGDICPLGHFCPLGSVLPSPCSAGMYCPLTMLSEPVGSCSSGYFCSGASTTPEQHPCPEGHYCPAGSGYPQPCRRGTYSNSTLNHNESNCLSCPSGMYCNEVGAVVPTGLCTGGYFCPASRLDMADPAPPDYICPRGHYCPMGSSLPIICNAGTYQPYEGQIQCLECPAGFFCDPSLGIDSVITPGECLEGYFCPAGTGFSLLPCPPGTFSNSTQLSTITECTACHPGMYCQRFGLTSPEGPCFAGYFCGGGADSPTPQYLLDNTTIDVRNGECPIGFYCPESSREPIPCPKGTFSQNKQVTSLSGCRLCPRGRYCDFSGAVVMDLEEPPRCSAGYVCTEGSITPTPQTNSSFGFPCSAGFFCEEGAITETSCTPGTYNPDTAQGYCRNCTGGMQCPLSGMIQPFECLPGYYCPEGTSQALPCPTGTFSAKVNLSSIDECQPCDPGRYCDDLAQTSTSGDCAAGYYCRSGASDPQPMGGDVNGLCPAGSFCPEGTMLPIPCPAGTTRSTLGAANESECHPCPSGHYCADTNLTAPSGICAPGYYCPGGVQQQEPIEFRCPKGTFCVAGSSLPTLCLPGYYQPQEGQSTCSICPPSQYCTDGTSVPEDCPPFSFCPEGTGNDIPLCPPGTYTPDTLTRLSEAFQCLPCPAGSYCINGQVGGECLAGYFCLSANPSPSPNSTFDYSPLDGCSGSANASNCELITSYLSTFFNTSLLSELDILDYNEALISPCNPITPYPILGGYCRASHYCPEGTLEPIPCPEGTFNPEEGGSQLSDCLPCPAGAKCVSGDPNPIPCPLGHYCPIDSVSIPCPMGTYRNQDSGTLISDCFSCPAGFWCRDNGTADFASYVCPPGHYCPIRTLEPILCPPGTHRNQSGGEGVGDCSLCTGGYYCPSRFCSNETLQVYVNTSNILDVYTNTSDIHNVMINASGLAFDTSTCECTPEITVDSHIHGIPCSASYYCPIGSAFKLLCPGGYRCESQATEPTPCDEGYYCPPGSEVQIRCDYPFYCPAVSEIPSLCPNGSIARNSTILRISSADSCTICEPGYYSDDGLECYLCPEGYYCQDPSVHPFSFPCIVGHYCPSGSFSPIPCPEGYYNSQDRSINISDCIPCPGNTYSQQRGKQIS